MGMFRNVFKRKESGDVVEVTAEGESGTRAKSSSLVQRLRRKSKREQQLEALQAGYGELLGLIRSIRTHMDGQTATQEKLLEVMQGMPDAMEGLKAVGRATEQQSEAINRFADGMTGFNQALSQIDETNKSLANRTKESEDLLKDMLRRSERRMAILITVLVILCVSVLSAGIYFSTESRGILPILGEKPVAEMASEADAVEESIVTETAPEEAVEDVAPETEDEE